MLRWVLIWVVLGLLLSSDALALSPQARRGRKIVERSQCTRCHDVSDAAGRHRGVRPAKRQLHCVGCHRWVLETRWDDDLKDQRRAVYPDWDRYLENVVHFTGLPDLGTLTRRVDPRFIRGFLDAACDLRPHLDESMIPVRLKPREKDAVVAYLAELNRGFVAHLPATPPTAPPPDRIAAGRALFSRLTCPTCHLFGDAKIDAKIDPGFYAAMKPVAQHAPNLRFVRQRIPRPVLVRHIQDPQSVDPNARMPKQDVTPEQAELLADFLLFGDPGDTPPRVAARPEVPLLSRPVSYDEVYGEVFGQICVHCHMNPRNNHGEGGPGNTGGLGYAGVHLDLETYAGARRGILRDGKRVSILDPGPNGEPPLLLEALLRRYNETSADPANPAALPPGDRPGMPMSLPPLTKDQLSLIKTWLAAGAPGPRVAARLPGRR